jgi:rhamnogalacturonyl hydrolase YesR
MGAYFSYNVSIHSRVATQEKEVLETIANRYIGNNPPHPMIYRTFHKQGFTRNFDYRYHFNLSEQFPEAKDGQMVYAWAKLWMEQPSDIALALNCFGPTSVFLGDQLIFRSTIVEETNPNHKAIFRVKVKKGWNHFVLTFTKTPSGIGGIFGTGSYKRYPLHFLTPSDEREGQEGWIFSYPLDKELTSLPSLCKTESETGIIWCPMRSWSEENEQKNQLARMFGNQADRKSFALAWTKMSCKKIGLQTYKLRGENKGTIQIYIDGCLQYHSQKDSEFELSITLPYGDYHLIVISQYSTDNWGFHLEPVSASEGIQFLLPHPILGAKDAWLFLGTFLKDQIKSVLEKVNLDTLFEGENGKTFWRVDQPSTVVRAYLENSLYGKWDYPLGVTLYGMLQTAKMLKRDDMVTYTNNHIESSVILFQYSLWDKEQYGAAGVNNQLSAIDSLDDCGSFGATMLRASNVRMIRGADEVADHIATYISNIQDRLTDGTLYRKRGHVDLMKETLWCDDLYMSIPFLCRYYEKTGDKRYLDDAATQFINYKKYLYMSELKIMSHVYDFKFKTATKVPWGRGNGWVLFSLSELLEILPHDHERRDELIQFFCDLCEGYLKLQGENGLWHQVLTDSESYEETSCTSMFVYAFARGIRFGWIKETQPYIKSVYVGWEGLTKRVIDRYGNIYGVCQGSGYSFTGDYYKNDLTWILNDTHGIGIVLLAGIETLKLKESLKYTQSVLNQI